MSVQTCESEVFGLAGKADGCEDPTAVSAEWQRDVERLRQPNRLASLRDTREDERSLRASEQMYREMVENATDLIYVTDLQGNFTSINRAARRISGYGRSEALKMNIAQLVASDHLETARQMIQKALRGEPATTYDLDIVA